MELLILKTNIKSKKKVKRLLPILNNHQAILRWTVDLEDIDRVLRVEANSDLNEQDLIHLIASQGFSGALLEDEISSLS